MMSKKYVIVMALLGIFSISAMVMPTTTYASEKVYPYCDLLDEDSSEPCHDRRDYYDGGPKNGLFPCNDGTDRTNWEDCPDVSGFDYNSSNDDPNEGGSNSNEDEKDRNCGGEPCTDYEKEDSWTEEEEGTVEEDALFESG